MIKRLKDKLAAFGLAVHNRRQENRKRLAALRAIQDNAIHGGQVWKSNENNAEYQVLFLTNLYTDGSIQVVYSRHWAYISSMPLEDFFDKFKHVKEIDNSLPPASDDLMAMATNMFGRSTVRKPQEGEYWSRVDRVPSGFDEQRNPVFMDNKATIQVRSIVHQSPSQPFVLYKENGEDLVLNMHQFLNRYSPETEENVD